MIRWVGLFVGIPLIELVLLIEIGQRIGTTYTIGIIIVTGVLGATLARQQGLSVIGQLQRETAEGRMPAVPLVDGVLVVIAAIVLLTPGLLTDAVGFALLVPAVRRWLRGKVLQRLQRAVAEGRAEFVVHRRDDLP
jgi:UPF0716 protein FxsA